MAMLASLPMLMCAGCSTLSGDGSVSRDLPEAPDYLNPVAIPRLAAGQDIRIHDARMALALDAANGRLADGRRWYMDCIRKGYAHGNVGAAKACAEALAKNQ